MDKWKFVGQEARGNLKPVERAKAVSQGQSAKRVAPVHEPIIKEPKEPVVTAGYAWCDGLLSPPFYGIPFFSFEKQGFRASRLANTRLLRPRRPQLALLPCRGEALAKTEPPA